MEHLYAILGPHFDSLHILYPFFLIFNNLLYSILEHKEHVHDIVKIIRLCEAIFVPC